VYILSEVGGSLTFKNFTSLLFDMDSGRVWWVYCLIISVQSGILGMAYQLYWFSKPCLHNFYRVVIFQCSEKTKMADLYCSVQNSIFMD
jgi:hypothetical protein